MVANPYPSVQRRPASVGWSGPPSSACLGLGSLPTSQFPCSFYFLELACDYIIIIMIFKILIFTEAYFVQLPCFSLHDYMYDSFVLQVECWAQRGSVTGRIVRKGVLGQHAAWC